MKKKSTTYVVAPAPVRPLKKHGRRMTARERRRVMTKAIQWDRWLSVFGPFGTKFTGPIGLHAVGDDDGGDW